MGKRTNSAVLHTSPVVTREVPDPVSGRTRQKSKQPTNRDVLKKKTKEKEPPTERPDGRRYQHLPNDNQPAQPIINQHPTGDHHQNDTDDNGNAEPTAPEAKKRNRRPKSNRAQSVPSKLPPVNTSFFRDARDLLNQRRAEKDRTNVSQHIEVDDTHDYMGAPTLTPLTPSVNPRLFKQSAQQQRSSLLTHMDKINTHPLFEEAVRDDRSRKDWNSLLDGLKNYGIYCDEEYINTPSRSRHRSERDMVRSSSRAKSAHDHVRQGREQCTDRHYSVSRPQLDSHRDRSVKDSRGTHLDHHSSGARAQDRSVRRKPDNYRYSRRTRSRSRSISMSPVRRYHRHETRSHSRISRDRSRSRSYRARHRSRTPQRRVSHKSHYVRSRSRSPSKHSMYNRHRSRSVSPVRHKKPAYHHSACVEYGPRVPGDVPRHTADRAPATAREYINRRSKRVGEDPDTEDDNQGRRQLTRKHTSPSIMRSKDNRKHHDIQPYRYSHKVPGKRKREQSDSDDDSDSSTGIYIPDDEEEADMRGPPLIQGEEYSHVPLKFINKIQKDKYVDFKYLLKQPLIDPDKRTVSVNEKIEGTKLVYNKREYKEITLWSDWLTAFMVFSAIFTDKFPSKAPNLLNYLSTVKSLFDRGGDFLLYDERYRRVRSNTQHNKKLMDWKYVWQKLFTESRFNGMHNRMDRIGNDSGRQKQQEKKMVKKSRSDQPYRKPGFCWPYQDAGICYNRDTCTRGHHKCQWCFQDHGGDQCTSRQANTRPVNHNPRSNNRSGRANNNNNASNSRSSSAAGSAPSGT